MLDIVLQFFLQVPSADESYWIFRQDSIMKLYVKRHFLFDLLSVCPSEVFIYIVVPENEPELCSLIQFLKLFRLARMPRLLYRWKHDVGMT